MKGRHLVFAAALATWLLLCWALDWQHVLIGILAAAVVAFLTADFFPEKISPLKNPAGYWYFFAQYVPIFIWECIKANIDVARIVAHPGLPINPGIVKVRTRLKTDIALTFLANSITLTPGTMSVDLDRERGILYIHWIDVKTSDIEQATKIIVEPFEKVLVKIFERDAG